MRSQLLFENSYASITAEEDNKYILHFHDCEKLDSDRVADVTALVSKFIEDLKSRQSTARSKPNPPTVIADFSNVDDAFTDSMKPLFMLAQSLKIYHGNVIVAGGNARIDELILMTRLEKFVTKQPDIATALMGKAIGIC